MPDVGQAPGLYGAVPRLSLDGTAQDGLSGALTTLLVEETDAGLSRCEATFANWGPRGNAAGFLYLDRQVLEFGKTLKVETGAGDAAGAVFEGKIMALEGRYLRQRPPEILALAEDRLQDFRMTRRTRTFENVSDSDIFQQVASGQGLQANVNVNGPTHKSMAQLNQSDLAFLRERARAVDAELWVSGSTLNVESRGSRKANDLTLTYGQGLHEMVVMADLAGQISSFKVSGWDVSGKQPISYKATDSALSGELNGDQSGSTILGQTIAQRDQQVSHRLPADTQEAQSLAEAHFRRTARRFLTGNGVAEGDARLRVGTKLELKGLGQLFEGKYYVTRVRHTFDLAQGYRTAFSVERPGIGQ
jgi:uncharacterized protein